MSYDIPDAPWIEEAERTGHYRYGYWNNGPGSDEDEPDDEEEDDDE